MFLLRNLFNKQPKSPAPVAPPVPPPLPPEPEEEEIIVPEVSVTELQTELAGDTPPFVLDVREPYEWQQVRLPGAIHIPMNEIPDRLGEVPSEGNIVVLCAHGMRSYSVAGYLLQEGYTARSLEAGLSGWAREGGSTESGMTDGGTVASS